MTASATVDDDANMDNDATMDDAQESNYPDPSGSSQTPYPTVLESGTILHEGYVPSPQLQLPSRHHAAARTQSRNFFGLSSNAIANANAYQKFAQQFYAEHDGPGQRPQLPFPELEPDLDESAQEGRLIANDWLSFGLRPEGSSSFAPDFDSVAEAEANFDQNVLGGLPVSEDTNGPLEELVGANKRGRPKGNRGRRGWKWAVKDTAHDTTSKPKSAERGRGRPRGSGRGRGRKRAGNRIPGPQFKTLQTKAMNAFMQEDLENALDLARQAVQADPEIYAAHLLIADILEKQGRQRDALAALLSGAHTQRDCESWMTCAEKTWDVAGDNPTRADIDQALYCYSEALKCDKTHYEARAAKRDCYLELKEWSMVERNSNALLNLRPYDLDNIRKLLESINQQGHERTFKSGIVQHAYEAAFDHYAAEENCEIDTDTLWSHLNVYLDLLDRIAEPSNAIQQLKIRARWLLGRNDETFWDSWISDDREFDTTHGERRVYVGEFQQGKASRDLSLYGEGLPLEIRIKLGFFRIRLNTTKDREEGTRHLRMLFNFRDNVRDVCDWFWDVGEGMRKYGFVPEAIEFYEPLVEVIDEFDDPAQLWMQLGYCYRETSRFHDSERCYNTLLARNRAHIEGLAALAKLYEMTGQHGKARPIITEVEALGHRRALEEAQVRWRPAPVTAPEPGRRLGPRIIAPFHSLDQNGSAREKSKQTPMMLIGQASGARGPGRPSESARAQFIVEQAARLQASYGKLEELWPMLNDKNRDGDVKQWLDCADAMCDEFRSMKIFFKRDKSRFTGYTSLGKHDHSDIVAEMEAMKARINADGDSDDGAEEDHSISEYVPKDFHNIPFAKWHRIFVEAALQHAGRANQDRCYWLLDAALHGNVFWFDKEMKNTTLAAQIHCALIFNDSATLIQVSREYVTKGQDVAGASFQLLSALSRLSYQAHWFSASPSQKFMLRKVKQLDWPLLPPDLRHYAQHATQKHTAKHKIDKLAKSGHTDHQLDAGALMLYGQMTAVANHAGGTLPYYYRAFALQPDNVCVNISIGLMHIQAAMKRVTENRQWHIHQGLSFVYRYHRLRTASGKAQHLQEAEYNMGRTWHLLGLTHLAIGPYEKALGLSERVQQERAEEEDKGGEVEVADFAQEAALALRDILALTGNVYAAGAITEKWLVI